MFSWASWYFSQLRNSFFWAQHLLSTIFLVNQKSWWILEALHLGSSTPLWKPFCLWNCNMLSWKAHCSVQPPEVTETFPFLPFASPYLLGILSILPFIQQQVLILQFSQFAPFVLGNLYQTRGYQLRIFFHKGALLDKLHVYSYFRLSQTSCLKLFLYTCHRSRPTLFPISLQLRYISWVYWSLIQIALLSSDICMAAFCNMPCSGLMWKLPFHGRRIKFARCLLLIRKDLIFRVFPKLKAALWEYLLL